MSAPKLEIINLVKEYEDGAVVAVDDIDLSIAQGETVALLGSSGCGKSTTLNMIVGLETPTSGDIRIDGKSILHLPAGKRDVGLVFQDYAVFTSMTVKENLAFGLAVRKTPKAEIERIVAETAELLGMSDRLSAKARELGGSELQRVAIGRTLATRPSILLLDEPLSNLEAEARLAMRRELRRLQAETGLTIIYVTHDQIEALSLADRIAVMNAGKILQVEETARICEQPDHVFVAGFLGSPPMNLVRGEVARCGEAASFSREGFSLDLPRAVSVEPGRYTLGLRPESLRLAAPGSAPIRGVAALIESRGGEAVVTVEAGSVKLNVITPAHDRPEEGREVGVDIEAGALVFFGGDSNRRVEAYPAGRTL